MDAWILESFGRNPDPVFIYSNVSFISIFLFLYLFWGTVGWGQGYNGKVY